VEARLAGPVDQAGERTLHLHRLNIGPRLTIGFALVIVAMMVGNGVLLWQVQRARTEAELLNSVDQELIAILRAHVNLMSFYERLEELAQAENADLLVSDAGVLRDASLEERRRTENILRGLPQGVHLDPTLLPTLEAIQEAMPVQLNAIIDLARSGEWGAVRLRVANQVRPLESASSELVRNIGRQVGEERAQAVYLIAEAQRGILLILPMTAAVTLLFAAFLGLRITRSITRPLGRLMEGSTAWGSGDFNHRVPDAGNDEIARLGSVFNNMAGRLKELYRELQRRETYLAEAQRLSRTGSFGWNVSSGEIYWSEETFRIFEVAPNTRITLELIMQRTHPEDRFLVQELIEDKSRAKREFDLEHRLLFPDGSVKHLRVVGHPSMDEQGSFEFVGAVTDITGNRRAEESLRQSQATLARIARVTTLGEITATIAHEVNQPLAGAITNASTCLLWLERDPPDLAEAREAASRSVNDATRAADIIARIRKLFKKGVPQREPVDVNEVIREMIVLLRNEADRHAVSIRSDLAADLPGVMADRLLLQQVIVNLMLNGVEAMKDTGGGELVVQSRQAEDGNWLVSVSDTGVGMTSAQQERIFDAFFTTKTQGTGLGLSISRSIIESHDGRLWALANSGRGTTFHFTLPCENEVTQ
jgi:signal transduction histidine kinase/HAMP domain-containing protein